ncbi:MAG: zinc-binding dehydrogenase [Planctomycetota bacterium]
MDHPEHEILYLIQNPMTTTLSAIFDGSSQPWRFLQRELPDLRSNEILVKVLACTICGSDLHSVDGRRSVPLPTILGHEIVGEIVAFGDDTVHCDLAGSPLHIGDRIVWAVVASCDQCYYCHRKLPQKCEMGFKYGHQAYDGGNPFSGGYSGHCILVQGTKIVRLPPSISLEAACPLSCATSTIAAAMRVTGIGKDHSVLVLGAGMLGLTACAMAKEKGASPIVCVDVSLERAELASRFGATHVFSGKQTDASSWKPITKHGFDIGLECTGHNDATRLGIESLRMGGRLGLVGAVFPSEPLPIVMERLVRRQISLIGIHNYGPEDLVAAVHFMQHAESKYPFAELVGPVFPLNEIDSAMNAARSSKNIRVCVRPTSTRST